MQPYHLAESNASRHSDIVRQTISAIEALRAEGKRISFYAVADKAQISRSTLYRCDDLRALVEEARAGETRQSESETKHAVDIAELERRLAQVTTERDALQNLAQNITVTRYASIKLASVA